MQNISNLRVLIVEDLPSDLELTREALSQIGKTQTVHHVHNMADFETAVGQTKYDVILLDLCLPETRGLETITKARSALERTDNGHTPIIVLTGVDDFAMSKGVLKAGAKDYLVKGEFGAHELSRALTFATFGKNNPKRAAKSSFLSRFM